MKRLFLFLLAVFLLLGSQALFAGGQPEPETRELTLLTWNHAFYEETIRQWVSDFESTHPNATINWVDKKGGELPTYYQTQLATGSPPDLVDIQGMIWYGYAEDGILYDLTPLYEADSEMQSWFDKNVLDVGGRYKDRLYMIPHYAASTVLFYNKSLFDQAGIGEFAQTVDELIADASKLTGGQVAGLVSLNFDWEYWPVFRANGVTILDPSSTKAAFNTPAGVETLQTLADLTADGVIDKVTWTGRWAEPNGVFGAGNAAMLHAHINAQRAFRSKSEWAEDPNAVGVAPFPGGWSVPNYHSIGVYAKTKYPELAWDMLKVISSKKWNIKYGVDIGTLPSNKQALEELLSDPNFAKERPLLARMFEVNMSVSNRLCGVTGSPKDAEIKDAVYSNVQQAVLGQKSAEAAFADAEKAVNEILAK